MRFLAFRMLLALALLQAAAPVAIERTGAFANRRLTESSGVVASRAHPGVLWTHNDSGDEGFLYATDLTGADHGRVRVPGIAPIDAEDLSEGPCPAAAGRCLYLADTGDNRETRAWVAVYAVPEPARPGGPADTLHTTAAPLPLRLRYPDGPHDVEATFVTEAGIVHLVTKGRAGTVAVYRVPRTAWTGEGVATAELVQTLAIAAGWLGGARVTGAALARWTPGGAADVRRRAPVRAASGRHAPAHRRRVRRPGTRAAGGSDRVPRRGPPGAHQRGLPVRAGSDSRRHMPGLSGPSDESDMEGS